jgi:chromosome segregation protein
VYLKRIDISGFKSFPDPTTIIFNRGVTSVVGPNGCGKTNILDAIRWVLGEQRPRLLRGGRMEEVIFSGTRQRPPLNMAEVTLMIDNRSGRLPVSYTEVAVSRRLFRSGESEYLINKTPCRLKDVYELLADTGFGSHSYSVIGQGMIDSLLSDNPEDRRFLFEEAAGISKYKARKKEALNKLKATDNDLVRVGDIRNEVETRVKELRVQVFRAKRYKKISDQLAGIEWERLLGEYRQHERELTEIKTDYDQAQLELDKHQSELTHAETDLEQSRLELSTAEAQAAEISEALNAAVESAHQAETELVRDRERLDNLTRTITRLANEIAEQNKNDTRWTADLADLRRQARELADGDLGHKNKLQNVETRYQEEDRKLGRIRATREDLADRVRDGERRYGQYRADLTHRAEQAQTRAMEKEELATRLQQSESEKSELEQILSRHNSQKNRLTDELESTSARLATTEAELTANEKKTIALNEQLNRCENDISGRQAQADTLAGIVARGEGLGQGAEAILKIKDSFPGGIDGWAQRISAPSEITAALEAALASAIGALWCETPEVADQIRRYLQENEVGRACLWDPSLPVPQTSTWTRPPVDNEGFRGWLIDHCQIDAGIRPMAEVLLFSVMLADSAENARQIFCRFSGEYTVVALDGTAYIPPGLVYSGRGGATVLGRTELLAQLEKDLTADKKRLQELQNEHQKLQSTRAELATSARELHLEKERLTTELNTLELEIGRAQARQFEVERRISELIGQLEKVKTGLTEAENRRREAEESQRKWESSRQELVDHLAGADRELEAQETNYRVALNILNEERMAGVELSGRVERLAEEIDHKEELLAQNTQAREERIRGKEQSAAEKERLNASITERETLWADLLAEKDRLSEQRNAALHERDAQKESFTAREKTVRTRRAHRDEAETIRHRSEIKRSESAGKIEQLEHRAAEKFNKNPENLKSEAQKITAEAAVSDEDIAALKARLERIGPVNLLALEEFEKEKSRLEFLTTQIDDLDSAKTSLNKTINELNRTAGERFLATFEAARLNFQSVFTDLFQGGEADVRLADPENPLESPIEIYARPRGKKALGIRHLSGGERALTAIGMLFGLYLVKPSPFCILDEVDAPLDDANTSRFLRLVERFKTKTQFVTITHNKLTMESADNLYGVTMEQPGVSRLVSVRLNPDQPEDEILFTTVRREEAAVSTRDNEPGS